MPHGGIRNPGRGSGDRSPELSLRVGPEKDHRAVRVPASEAQALGHERADLAWGEVCDRHDRSTDEIARPVPRLNGGGRLSYPMEAEIDPQLVRRITRLGKVLGGDDATHAHLDFLKILERDGGHGLEPCERPRSI